MLASGGFLLLGPPWLALPVVAFLAPMFGVGQLGGALSLSEGRAPRWLLPLGLGLAVLRVGFPADSAVAWVIAGAIEPLFTGSAAWTLYAAFRRGSWPIAGPLLPPLLLAAALLEGLSGWTGPSGAGLPDALLVGWALLAAVGAPLQLQFAAARGVREQQGLQEQAEQELREVRDRFRALTESAFDIVAELDGRGRIAYVNPRGEEILGSPPEAWMGLPPGRFVHPEDRPALHAFRDKARANGRAAGLVLRARTQSGEWRWLECVVNSFPGPGAEPRWALNLRDVSERRSLEERLERERDRLEAAVAERTIELQRSEARVREAQRLESLGVLAGGIAHDFNNLLAVILGNAELLERDDEDRERRLERLGRIRVAGRHAEALTDQLLTYAGKSVPELEPLDLSQLVGRTDALLRASVPKSCALALELEDGLPPVLGDTTQLRQVLLNLVCNAGDALGTASGRIRVRTARAELDATQLLEAIGSGDRTPGEWVLLEVQDDGPGMSEALRRHVFEPFFTTRGARRGLGLATVLGIASAHRGLLKVESTPGRGSSFQLLLPPADPLSGACGARRSEEPCAPACTGRVLVVDDDEAVCEVARELLEREGLVAESRISGPEALARVRESPAVDAVLLDLGMPDMSGEEVLRELQRERPGLPVVIASGYKRELAAERVDLSKVSGFLEKPFEARALISRLRMALESRDPH